MRKAVNAADVPLSGTAGNSAERWPLRALARLSELPFESHVLNLEMPAFSNALSPICQTSINLALHLKYGTLMHMRCVWLRNKESP